MGIGRMRTDWEYHLKGAAPTEGSKKKYLEESRDRGGTAWHIPATF